jgi:hypothetical protein
MSILVGVLVALPGGLAALAGVAAMHRRRWLRRGGVTTWAMAVPSPVATDEHGSRLPPRTLIQYQLTDGTVMEQICPRPAGRAASLQPGQKVLIWYDPADPQDVLVYGREGRRADRAFVLVGALLILVGTGIALFGP